MVNGKIDIWITLFTLGQYALVLLIGYLAYCGLIWNISQFKEKRAMSLDNTIDVYEKKKKLYQVRQEYFDLKKELKLGFFKDISNQLFDTEPSEEIEEAIEDLQNTTEFLKKQLEESTKIVYNPNDATVKYVLEAQGPPPNRELKLEDTINDWSNILLNKFNEDVLNDVPEETKEVEILSLTEELEKDPDFLSHSDEPNSSPQIINNSSQSENNSTYDDGEIPQMSEPFIEKTKVTKVNKNGPLKRKKKFSFFSPFFKKR